MARYIIRLTTISGLQGLPQKPLGLPGAEGLLPTSPKFCLRLSSSWDHLCTHGSGTWDFPLLSFRSEATFYAAILKRYPNKRLFSERKLRSGQWKRLDHGAQLQKPSGANGSAFVAGMQDSMDHQQCLKGTAFGFPNTVLCKHRSLCCRHASQLNGLVAVFTHVSTIVQDGR